MKYPKIQSVYKRDPATKYRTFLTGEWSVPEFGLLADITWLWTEKIDGTNIRLTWDGETVRLGGRTDNAQIPTGVIEWFGAHIVAIAAFLRGNEAPIGTTIYGEGCGRKIQRGGENYGDTQRVILFDVLWGSTWMDRSGLEWVADMCGVGAVPTVARAPISTALDLCLAGLPSVVNDADFRAEGLVGVPELPLLDRQGNRIVTKIKCKDFD